MIRQLSPALTLLAVLAMTAPAAAQRESETFDRTLTLAPGGTLVLKTFSGRVRISGGAGDKVTIKAVRTATRDRLKDIALDVSQSGSTITIDANHHQVEHRNDNVVDTDFDIQVPGRTTLDVTTFSAPVTVVGVNGPHHIGSFSADVSVEATEWADGNHLDIKTFSGDVTLRLPASARGDIDFDSFSGRFDSDLPVTLGHSSRRNFRGALNGGGAGALTLKTFSGSVSIRK